ERPVETCLAGKVAPRRVEAHDPALAVDDQQPTPDVQCCGGHDLPAIDECKLGRAPTDIDIEDARSALVRYLGRPRAVGRKHRFHVVARSSADEFAALV